MFGVLFNLGNPAVPLYTNSLGISGYYVGFYLASTGFGLFVFSALWGALGDIKDRNKVLGLVYFGFGVGQLMFGFFSSEIGLLIASLVSGIFFAGVLVNIYSYINDSFAEKYDRDKVLSYTVSLYLIGGAIAYIIGGLIADQVAPNYNYLFYLQGFLLILFSLYIYFEKTDLTDTDHHLSRRFFWLNVKQMFKLPWVPIFTITLTFFISFSHNNVRRFMDYYIIDNQYSATTLGLVVFVAGVISLLSNMYITPFFLKRMHHFRFLQLQFLIAPILLFLIFYVDNLLIGVFTFYMGYTMMLAIYEPTAISFMSTNKEVSQGVLIGIRQSIVGLGTTIGFVVGGVLYEIEQTYVFYLAVLFYIIVFVGFSILILLKRNEVKEYRVSYLRIRGEKYD
jgi:DHA1 family multidrug resistance protein-like MFS transporter